LDVTPPTGVTSKAPFTEPSANEYTVPPPPPPAASIVIELLAVLGVIVTFYPAIISTVAAVEGASIIVVPTFTLLKAFGTLVTYPASFVKAET
jgi:hypothetical protein